MKIPRRPGSFSFSFTLALTALALLGALLSAPAKPLARIEAVTPVPADQPIPIVDFFRTHLFTSARLNPAGTHLAALNPNKKDSQNLFVLDLATRKMEGIGGGDGIDIYDFDWLDDHRLLYRVSRDKLYAYGLFSADVTKLTRTDTLDLRDVAIPIGAPRGELLKPVVWIKHSSADGGRDGGLVQLDAAYDNRSATLPYVPLKTFPSPKTGVPVRYLADNEGELAHAITIQDGVDTLHRLTPSGWQPCPVDLDKIVVVGSGDQPGELIVLADDDAPAAPSPSAVTRRPGVLRRLDAATGRLGQILHRDENYSPYPVGLYRRPRDGHILGLSFTRRGPETIWLDPDYAALQATLQAALPGVALRIVNSDREEKQFLLFAQSDVLPGRYYHFDRTTKKLTIVTDNAPWLDPRRQAAMQLIAYPARDGIKIEGYYTAPAGPAKPGAPPLVVLPHGGPWVRDHWGWDPEVQFLASRGYAVFQPNYRGSSGTAWRFPAEDEWAFRKMHDDVTDGVRVLIQSGLADPDRIAIMGASFGGYLAVCGAAYEGNLYRCAITVAGVFDWEQAMREARDSETSPASYGILRRYLGDPKAARARFEEISPLRSAERIAIPVFIAHGREDRVANFAESKKLASALKARAVPCETMFVNGEGHGFQQLENKVELYARLEKFLAYHLSPRPAAH
jgi:acetyl esterase/lipase